MSKATLDVSPASADRRAGASERRAQPRSTTNSNRASRPPERPPAVLGREALSVAQRRGAAILEVLAGEQTAGQAAGLLGISVMHYYLLERRAVQGLVAACAPRPKGPPGPRTEQEVTRLRRELERSRRECLRQAALVRATQRALGFSVAAKPASAGKSAAPAGKCARRRRTTVRALRAAHSLRENSSGLPTPGVVERLPAEGDAPLRAGSGPPREGVPARTVTQEAEHGTQRQEATRDGACGAAGGIGAGQAAADHDPPDAAG